MDSRVEENYVFKYYSGHIKVADNTSGKFAISTKSIEEIKKNNFSVLQVDDKSKTLLVCFDKYEDFVELASDIKTINKILLSNKDYINFELYVLVNCMDLISKYLCSQAEGKRYCDIVESDLIDIYQTAFNENADADSRIRYFSLSSILGAFLGDSLGSYVEFKRGSPSLYNESIVFKKTNPIWGTAPGQLTDDSELAISQGLGIYDSESYDMNRVAYYYGLWYLTDPFDIGTTTSQAVSAANEFAYEAFDCNKRLCNPSVRKLTYLYLDDVIAERFRKNTYDQQSLSNGFLMKNTPLATYCMKFTSKNTDPLASHFDKDDKNINLMQDNISNDRFLTHFREEIYFSSLVYSHLITRLVYLNSYFPMLTLQERCKNALNYIAELCGELCKLNQEVEILPEIIKIINDGKTSKFAFDAPSYYHQMGYHFKGLAQALYQLRTMRDDEKRTYFQCIKEVINLGGDTDTNAAIVGGVLGSAVGYNEFPPDLFRTLYSFNSCYKTDRPRPSIYSPGTALFFVPSKVITDKQKEKGCPYTISRMILRFLKNIKV